MFCFIRIALFPIAYRGEFENRLQISLFVRHSISTSFAFIILARFIITCNYREEEVVIFQGFQELKRRRILGFWDWKDEWLWCLHNGAHRSCFHDMQLFFGTFSDFVLEGKTNFWGLLYSYHILWARIFL